MSAFTSEEIQYLNSQRLGRLATAGPDCQPHVVPLAFRYNPEQDTIGVVTRNPFAPIPEGGDEGVVAMFRAQDNLRKPAG